MPRVFEMTSLRNHYSQVLPHAHQAQQSAPSALLATAARRLWLPLLALFLGLSYLLSTAPSSQAGAGGKRTSVGAELLRSAGAGGTRRTPTGLDDPEAVDWDGVSRPLSLGASVLDRLAAWEASPRLEPADWVYKSTEVRRRRALVGGRLGPSSSLTECVSVADVPELSDRAESEQAAA